MQLHREDVRECYEKALDKTPDLKTTLVVSFLISQRGNVLWVKVKESSVKHEALETCITGALKTWRFPSNAGGNTEVAAYPFHLSPLERASPGSPVKMER